MEVYKIITTTKNEKYSINAAQHIYMHIHTKFELERKPSGIKCKENINRSWLWD
jgi:hypothetical protein